MLLKDYKYCFSKVGPIDNCTALQNRECMCFQVWKLNQSNKTREKYGYREHLWFDWEPLPEPPQ